MKRPIMQQLDESYTSPYNGLTDRTLCRERLEVRVMNATVTVEPHRTLIAFTSPTWHTSPGAAAYAPQSKKVAPRRRLRRQTDVENAMEISQLLRPDELRQFVGRLRRVTASAPADRGVNPLVALLSGEPIYDVARRRRLEENALLRQIADRRALLAGAVKTSAVARLLGRSRQAIHDRVHANSLLAINDCGELRFPLWQFDPAAKQGVVPGLPDVLRALDVSPLSKARWLIRPNRALEGRAPLDALKAGERERVVSEAHGVGLA